MRKELQDETAIDLIWSLNTEFETDFYYKMLLFQFEFRSVFLSWESQIDKTIIQERSHLTSALQFFSLGIALKYLRLSISIVSENGV